MEQPTLCDQPARWRKFFKLNNALLRKSSASRSFEDPMGNLLYSSEEKTEILATNNSLALLELPPPTPPFKQPQKNLKLSLSTAHYFSLLGKSVI